MASEVPLLVPIVSERNIAEDAELRHVCSTDETS